MPPNISRTRALVASICAPVPLMRPQSAPVRWPAEQPGRSAAVAFDTRSAEPSEPTDDFHWRDGLARRFRSAWWQAALPTTDKAATGHLLAPAYRSNGGSQFPSTGAGFRPLGGGEPLMSHLDGWRPPSSRPMATRHHLLTDGPRDGTDQLRGQVARPEITRSVRSVPLFDVAGCLQDDAPVRRASRLRTTSDGARCAH
jgi:hypothetical protein